VPGERQKRRRSSRKAAIPRVDEALYEHLREWRRNKAGELGIAAFIVMHDATIEDLCRKRPCSLAEIRGVLGFGERKTELYGLQILEALKKFRGEANPIRNSPKRAEPSVKGSALLSSEVKPNPTKKSDAWWGAHSKQELR